MRHPGFDLEGQRCAASRSGQLDGVPQQYFAASHLDQRGQEIRQVREHRGDQGIVRDDIIYTDRLSGVPGNFLLPSLRKAGST